jgi:hypothetical protein
MNERIAVLVVVTLLELLGGLGLRNETQASKALIAVQRYRERICVERIQECRQIRRMAELAAARAAQVPEL